MCCGGGDGGDGNCDHDAHADGDGDGDADGDGINHSLTYCAPTHVTPAALINPQSSLLQQE